MGAAVETATSQSWAAWHPSEPFTVGIEEEIMLLRPHNWSLAYEIDAVLPPIASELGERVAAETHGAAIELCTDVNATVPQAAAELLALRRRLQNVLAGLALRAASAGTHPSAVWSDTMISAGQRYQLVYGSVRELARREPTFGLHVHIGVPTPEQGLKLYNRLRAHVPLLLALSVNSPFWQGRDTGLASARTPLFQAFPRVGIPRRFDSYAEYVETVDMLIRCDALPEATFLWWDVRPQPRFGTVEVRIMDAQTTVWETAALAALIQSIARLELEEGDAPDKQIDMPELLAENRFIAARDGMEAELIDPEIERRVPAREQLDRLLAACRPHAEALGCERELAAVGVLADGTGAARQLALARGPDRLVGLVGRLADAFVPAHE